MRIYSIDGWLGVRRECLHYVIIGVFVVALLSMQRGCLMACIGDWRACLYVTLISPSSEPGITQGFPSFQYAGVFRGVNALYT